MSGKTAHFRAAVTVQGVFIAIALLLAAAAAPARAEGDLSGSWLETDTQDFMERVPGPVGGFWAGIPFSESGRARALLYSPSNQAEPDRICDIEDFWELAVGPRSLRIWPEIDPIKRQIRAWVIGGSEDRAAATIWMDGRAHPSEYAPHTRGGFTTGSWSGDVLTAYTTHMKEADVRRYAAYSSDEATVTSTFIPYDDLLTVVFVMEDPVYLTAPYVYSRVYRRSVQDPVGMAWDPCIPDYEGISADEVAFTPPDRNPTVALAMKLYGIPEEATLGGAETMYPAFRDKMKAKFTTPPKCTIYCDEGSASATSIPASGPRKSGP